MALLGGDTDLEDRLAVLDAISSLLPAGAKAWLRVSCWADFGSNHQLRLTFAHRARDIDLAVDLRSRMISDGELSDGAVSYRRALLELCDKHGVDKVSRHLAMSGEIRERDVAGAQIALEELDLTVSALRAARAGALSPALLRRLDAREQFGVLSAANRAEVLTAYLYAATPAEVIADAGLLARHWPSAVDTRLDDALCVAVRRQLGDTSATIDESVDLARVAWRIGAERTFARALDPTNVPEWQRSAKARTAAAIAVRLSGDDGWAATLAPVVANSETLSVAMLRELLAANNDLTGDWVERLDVAGARSPWMRISTPYRLALSGGPHDISRDELDGLDRVDPDIVGDLVRLTHDRRPSYLERLLDTVLPWLRERLATGRVPGWIGVLGRLSPDDQRQQARIDFMLCCSARRPRQSLRCGSTYRDALVRSAEEAELSTAQQETLVDTVAARLDPGWSDDHGGFVVILDVLWRLANLAGRPPIESRQLITVLGDEVLARPSMLDTVPELERWLPWLEQDPRLRQYVVMSRLRHLTDRSSPTYVAQLIADLIQAGYPMKDMVGVLQQARWRPSVAEWAECLTAVTAALHRAGVRDLRPVRQLAARLMSGDGIGGVNPVQAAAELPAAVFPQVRMAVEIARLAAQRDREMGGVGSAQAALNGIRRQLELLIKEIEGEPGGRKLLPEWARWRSRPDDGRYRHDQR